MRGALTRRMLIASGLLALCVGGMFVAQLLAVEAERDAQRGTDRALESLTSSNELEKLVVDLETGLRGYIVTRRVQFLAPFTAARRAIPRRAEALRGLADRARQRERAERITAGMTSYIADYAVPVVDAVRRNDPRASSVATTAEGKRRVDALRAEFDTYEAVERAVLARRRDHAADAASRASAVAAVGLVASFVIIIVFTVYLSVAIVRPIRRAATMAGVLAGGNLSARMPETATGEIGSLEHSFNSMARSLETNRDALRRLAEEQAALRRVATLVARGAPLDDIFRVVAREIRGSLHADVTAFVRYEHDRTASPLAVFDDADTGVSLPDRLPADVATDAASIGQLLRDAGVGSVVGVPVVVEDRTWGVVVVGWTSDDAAGEAAEDAVARFGELVATAIANAESRAELHASRARIVAAADHARRRIERDLHDGTQQRLVALGLDVRAAQTRVPPGSDELEQHLSHIGDGLAAVVHDLQEVSRGIHPAILSKGGLGPALKTLARRAAVPVELDAHVSRRLPEPVEVAVYYVVSEALTNAAKHSGASIVHVDVDVDDQGVSLVIRDDGVGGADPRLGSGLVGLRDRVETLRGRIDVKSPPGQGTTVTVSIPAPDAERTG